MTNFAKGLTKFIFIFASTFGNIWKVVCVNIGCKIKPVGFFELWFSFSKI